MTHPTLEVACCADPNQEDLNEPRSPTLLALFKHLAAADDLALDDIFSNTSDRILDELAAFHSTPSAAAVLDADNDRTSWLDGTVAEAAAVSQQQHISSTRDSFLNWDVSSQVTMCGNVRAASMLELPATTAAADVAAAADAAAAGRNCYAADLVFRRASEAGQSVFLSRQTSNSSVMTVADWPLFVPVPDSLATPTGRAGSPRLDALQSFVASSPVAALTSPALPPATPGMAAAASSSPLTHSSSPCSGPVKRLGFRSQCAPVRTLRLPTLLPPSMLHCPAGAGLGSSSSMLPLALVRAMGLAAPAAVSAQPAAGWPAQMLGAGSAPAPLTLPDLSSAGFAAGATDPPCAGAPAAGAATHAAALTLSTVLAAAAGGAGDAPRSSANPSTAAPLHTSTSLGAGTALHACNLLPSSSSNRSSLAPAQSLLQQLLRPEDGKVSPTHAPSPQLAPAAAAAPPHQTPDSAGAGVGSGAAAGSAAEVAAHTGAAAAPAAQAEKGSMSPPPAKKPRAPRRAGSKACKPAKAAAGTSKDPPESPVAAADVLTAAPGPPATATPPLKALATSAAAGGGKAAAAADMRKLRHNAPAPAASPAATGAGGESGCSSEAEDEQQSGPRRCKRSRGSSCSSRSRMPKYVRDLAEVQEQIRLMRQNNSHLSAQLTELSSIKAQLQHRLAGMYASWSALEASNGRLREDNAEMQQVMAPFMHLLSPA